MVISGVDYVGKYWNSSTYKNKLFFLEMKIKNKIKYMSCKNISRPIPV
jgi:hypothetical protein